MSTIEVMAAIWTFCHEKFGIVIIFHTRWSYFVVFGEKTVGNDTDGESKQSDCNDHSNRTKE